VWLFLSVFAQAAVFLPSSVAYQPRQAVTAAEGEGKREEAASAVVRSPLRFPFIPIFFF
jgi:hypothetical protein